MSAVQPRFLLLTVSFCFLWSLSGGAATLPDGFSETRVATGLLSPTAMAIAPDGRVFVTEQGGALRVVKNDALLPEPFLTLSVSTTNTKGLLGVAFDPDFQSNRFLYVYYTTADAPLHPRVSRFTASSTNPDVAEAGQTLSLSAEQRLALRQRVSARLLGKAPPVSAGAAAGGSAEESVRRRSALCAESVGGADALSGRRRVGD